MPPLLTSYDVRALLTETKTLDPLRAMIATKYLLQIEAETMYRLRGKVHDLGFSDAGPDTCSAMAMAESGNLKSLRIAPRRWADGALTA